LKTVLQILGISKSPDFTTAFEKEATNHVLDFRNQIRPNSNASDWTFKAEKYSQVFEEKNGFIPNLSILDLIFCTGPQASFYLENSINI